MHKYYILGKFPSPIDSYQKILYKISMKKINVSIILSVLCLIFLSCSADSGKTGSSVSGSQRTVIEGNHIVGQFVDGTRFDTNDYKEKRLILGFFSFEHVNALPMLKALKKLTADEEKYHYKVLAVSINYNNVEGLKKFLPDNNINIPVVLEGPDLSIAEKFKLANEVAVVGLDAKHRAAFGVKEYIFAKMPKGEEQFLDYMKESLGVATYQPLEPRLGVSPKVPDFSAQTQKGGKIKLSDFRGKVVHVVFFSPKCPHCKHEIEFIRDELYPEYYKKGYRVIAITGSKLSGEMLKLYESFKAPWPLIEDSGNKVKKLFTNIKSVPENFIIDKKGYVKFYSKGYAAQRNNMYHMAIKKLLGLENDPDLAKNKYASGDSCKICHEAEHAEWSVTKHAFAWKALEFKAETMNAECVGCHSLGYDSPQGYKVVENKKTGKKYARVPPFLANVQCENCHGLGGPHVSKNNPVSKANLEKTCLGCHTEKFSPGFDVKKALPLVNHSRMKKIMGMSLEQREALVN